MNTLKDYFMLPQNIQGIGDIYPVKISEYEQFKKIASKYFIQGKKWLINICKMPKEVEVLDFFVNNALYIERAKEMLQRGEHIEHATETEKEIISKLRSELDLYNKNEIIRYSIKEMEYLFEMVLHKQVKFDGTYENKVLRDYRFIIDDDDKKNINKFNFDAFKKIVMEQNLLFEPLTSPSEVGNMLIQQAMESRMMKNGDSGDLEAICSVVSVGKHISDKELMEYTYYRLIYDFTTINRIEGNRFAFLLRSQGSESAEITDLSHSIDLNINPYDNLLQKQDHSLGQKLNKR
jgi:hypothetical protein